ncbi:hypothetical protein P3W33_11815 [Luteibacter sp. PPL552]
MSDLQDAANRALASIVALAELTDRAGATSLHSACFSAVLTLLDGCSDDVVDVDPDSLGFMAGIAHG